MRRPAERRSINDGDDGVGAQPALAVLEGNIAHHRDHFDLLIERVVPVFVLVPDIIAERDVAERGACDEITAMKPLVRCELQQSRYNFIPGFEDDDEGLLSALIECLEFHQPHSAQL